MSFISKTALLFLFAINIYAQGGIIKGKVVDKESSEPLIGANIIIIGTQQGAATDLNGLYEITNIPAGTYPIKAAFVGCDPIVKQHVDVKNSETLILNFEIEWDSTSQVIIIIEKPFFQEKITGCPRRPWSVDMIPIKGIHHFNILEKFKLNPPKMQSVLPKDTTTNKNISR